MGIKHAYTATGANDPDKEVSSNRWNEEHVIEAGTFTLPMLAAIGALTLLGNNDPVNPATPITLTPAQVKAMLSIAAGDVSGFGEAVDDEVASLLAAGANISLSYNDAGNSLTITAAATDLTYTAATRLLESSTGADVTLPLVSASAPGLMPAPEAGPARWYAFHDMMQPTGNHNYAFGQNGTGAGTTQRGGGLGGCGWVDFNLGTVATNRVSCTTALTGLLLGAGRAYFACRLYQLTLSDATNTHTQRVGFIDNVTTESTDGVFFRYTHSLNGGKWQAVCRSNGTETAADTGVTAAINTAFKMEIIVNAAGSSVDFIINGTTVATITTNIPTGAGREAGSGIMLLRSVGTAAVTPLAVDYLLTEQILTTAR